MKVKFTITMKDVVVEDRCVDEIELSWEEERGEAEVSRASHTWISTPNFLTQRMIGLTRVGESFLTIEPLEMS